MLLADRKATRKTDYLLAIALGLLFLLIGLGAPGFWEPWESGVVQVGRFVQSHAWDPHVFWVPQTENHLVHKPLGLIWSLAAVYALFDHPSEFVLRLPTALLALTTLLTTFAVARRFFTRRAAFATIVVLLSLPLFMFDARLLAGGMWYVAAASLPMLLFLLAGWAQTTRHRRVMGALFGASLGLSFVAGGLVPLAVAVASIAVFALWSRARQVLAAVANAGFAVAAPLAIALATLVFVQYLEHVPYALEDRAPIDAVTLRAEVAGDHVEAIGLRNGVITGSFDETAADKHGAERFVLSLDGSLRGTRLWQAWVVEPAAVDQLYTALAGKGLLEGDELAEFDAELDDQGALKATLQFFSHDLFDPTALNENRTARVRSIVAAAPATGRVHDTPETSPDFLARITQPLRPEIPELSEAAGDEDDAAPGEPDEDSAAASDRARRRPRRATNAQPPPLVLHNGQEVTILAVDEEASGWTEIQVNNRTGFVRSAILEPDDPLPHASFDIWVRHLGFGLFPWVLLLPVALGLLLLRRTQGQADTVQEGDHVGAFLLCWLAVATLALGVGASLFDNRAFVGVVPVGLATGLMLASSRFWARVDAAPFARKFFGFGAIAILAVLIHDYKEHPWLFIEAYLGEHEMQWAEKLQVVYTPFRLFRYVVALLFVAYFFGAVGFGSRLLEKTVRFYQWRFARPEGQAPGALSRAAGYVRAPLVAIWRAGLRYPAMALWGAAQQLRRARVVLVLMAVLFCGLSTFVYLPAMSHHLTQKGLLERYEELADEGEPLVSLQSQAQRSCSPTNRCEPGSSCIRGQCVVEATSFYLGHVPTIREPDLVEQLDSPERTFAIIPRKQLARINAEFRKQFDVGQRRNLAVLDTRSSRFLLVSNQLESGETNENYVGDLILDGRPEPMFKPPRPVRFTNGLEFLGYDLEPIEVASGEEFTVTYYFHVTKDITADWQMFLHVDFPGNRINGDHYPGDGTFHTNNWIAGDYVKDIQTLEVDRGSSAGVYEMFFGFFSSGSNRLGVETGDHHDNRVRMGTMRVSGGL